MKQLVFSTLILFLSMNMYAQSNPSDGANSKQDLSKFSKIVVNDNAIVTIKQDDGTPGIRDNNGKKLDLDVKNGVLNINGIKNVTIACSNVSQIEGNDVAQITVSGGLSKSVEIIGNDASKININATLENVVVEGNDATRIELSGSCKSLNIKTNDASLVEGDMTSDYLFGKSYDVSNIKIAGSKFVDTEINDQSNIEILKDPAVPEPAPSDIIEPKVPEDVYIEGNVDLDENIEKWNKKKMKWWPAQRVWAGFEMSIVGLSNKFLEFQPDQNHDLWKLDQPSVSFHVNLFEHKFKLGTEYLKFVTGLGFQWDVLRFKNDVTLNNTRDKVEILPSPYGSELKKNNLVLGQIQIPLLLNINTKPQSKYNFHIDGGVVVGYRFKQFLKQSVYTNYKTTIQQTSSAQFHQNPFDVSATVRLGVGEWSVFGMYDLASLYKKNEGPQLNVWNIGVTIIPF
ncbi:MAG: outer membrane beta-barrel protein [Saprospiraceae bacterium]|jgi:hypothetical protein|nr:outer membrane beta-barrel protein [Saprospiraceae bacterium]